MMLRTLLGSLTLLLLLVGPVAAESPKPASKPAPKPLPKTTPWDLQALQQAPEMEWLDEQGEVRSLLYAGQPYQGHPTKVFAWYASPATLGKAPADAKFPAVVLVHGGGGTAFEEWARLWASRGYAALAMDLAGRGKDRKPLEQGGPDQGNAAKFEAIDGPVGDQWTYHAVANVISGHSLLRSFPEVDADRTAVTGISWGGYLTCIVAGLDQRFQAAMPVYGCGFLAENSAWSNSSFPKMTPAQQARWTTLWDPSQYIGSATMPVLFVNGTNDFAYPLDSYAKTCALVQGEKNYSIQLRMRHGHIFDFPEFFVNIDHHLKNGKPLPHVGRPQIQGDKLTATVDSPTKLVEAHLYYTLGPHPQNKERDWAEKPLEINGKTLTGAVPPAAATAWYVSVKDDRGVVASSEPMIGRPAAVPAGSR
ncbi:alpha/beta hydrolase family protein [Lignipirellula cremea]|uniref:Alpha/beta hydrolase family protein n=1 Tax=Lignipirellula cremea TaxID=2528010 RepID=A0A518DUK0_9BACT|nr:alpha/beta fold hydrolase [Lignipirellula cremea]QDU95509.1 Alpha/beta hydrolase family protein [Lignipirellula cremea]